MAIEPAEVTRQVAALYYEAERQAVLTIAARIRAGLDAGDWRLEGLAQSQVLSRQLWASVQGVATREFWMETAGKAYLASPEAAALLEVTGGKVPPLASLTAVERIATEMADTMSAVNRTILRRADDTYARVIGQVVGENLAGQSFTTRAKAAQRAMDRFAAEGVGKFVDRSGRHWRLGDYVDMATRTGLHRAQIEGHEAALDAAGLDLVVVQPGPRACPICDKWARAVLSRNGATGTITVENAATGNPMQVRVDGTLEDARRAGFQHPNCRCSVRAFIPGVTRKVDLERPPYDEAAYKAQQAQRGLERDVRDAKMDKAKAVDPVARREAQERLDRSKARLDNHLATHGYLKRRTDREGIGPRGRFRPGQGGVADDIQTPPPGTPWGDAVRATQPKRAKAAPKVAPPPVKAPPSPKDPLGSLPRLAAPEDIQDAASVVNLRFKTDLNYRTNCHFVVGATEMRARGYDVVAAPTVNHMGRTASAISRDWRTADGAIREFTELSDLAKRPSIATLKAATADWPVGARGFVSGRYKRTRSGHIMNVTKTDKGLRIIEGQDPDTDHSGAAATLRQWAPDSISVLRVDDLVPTENIARIVDTAESATDALSATAQAARIRTQVNHLDRELEALAPELEAATAALDEVEARFSVAQGQDKLSIRPEMNAALKRYQTARRARQSLASLRHDYLEVLRGLGV